MVKKFDVAVIGGGPSGSAAAILLSQNGFSVCLIEKKSFPREVLCGEFISHEVINFLSENNMLDKFLSLAPNEISSMGFYNENDAPLRSPLGFRGYGLRRSKLDNLLVTKAIQTGTEIFQPTEVINIIHENPGLNLRIKNSFGEESEIYAHLVICSYGKQNILDKKLNRAFHNIKSGLNGIKYHIPVNKTKDINPNEIQIFTANNIYCGVNKIDDNFVTLCYLEKKDSRISSKNKLMTLYNANLHFRKIFPDLNCITEESTTYGTGNIYFGKRNLVDNGIFYTGDAAGVIAPLAGDGIGIAIESAQVAAAIITDLLRNKINTLTADNIYKKEYNQKLNFKLKTAYAVQNILLSNFIRRQATRIVNLYPSLLYTVIKYTRS